MDGLSKLELHQALLSSGWSQIQTCSKMQVLFDLDLKLKPSSRNIHRNSHRFSKFGNEKDVNQI